MSKVAHCRLGHLAHELPSELGLQSAPVCLLLGGLTVIVARRGLPITNLVPFEIGDVIEVVGRIRSITSMGHRAMMAVVRIEMVVYVTRELVVPMKTKAHPNENTA